MDRSRPLWVCKLKHNTREAQRQASSDERSDDQSITFASRIIESSW